MKKVRTRLIELRKKQNLKQRDVAKAVEITTSYYGMIEVGDRTPKLELARKIAQFFGVKMEDLFFEDSHNDPLSDELSVTSKERKIA